MPPAFAIIWVTVQKGKVEKRRDYIFGQLSLFSNDVEINPRRDQSSYIGKRIAKAHPGRARPATRVCGY